MTASGEPRARFTLVVFTVQKVELLHISDYVFFPTASHMTIIVMNWGGVLYHWITQFSDPIVTRSAKCADMYICVRACCRGSTRVYNKDWKA